MMRKLIKLSFIALILVLRTPSETSAQSTSDVGGLVQGTVTDSRDGEPLVGVNVVEIDVNNRVVSGTITDVNGRYVLKVKSLKSRLSTSYIGYNRQEKNISGNVVNFILSETSVAISEVDIVAAKKQTQGGYSIPIREIATSMQTFETKELEGIQVSSVDEALQGRIAGLDIVANSSDPGTGSTMRIRGVTSITGNNQPLIVINDVPYEYQIDPNFDYAHSNQEQYANMLSINPDDILEITVLKDAGASAIWGSRGANGVIMITTKRGSSGPTRVDYTYRFTRTVQPKGLKMLNGDNFTMLMKEAYFNPRQDKTASDIPEYNYDMNNPNYEQYNNNTDWIDAVTQVGQIHDHYITVSGGGERANFRISGGFLNQNGTIIGQNYNRVSSRSNLDYRVSDRIKFFAEFSLTNSDNERSYKPILGIAYQKMPNVSIYEQDRDGNDTKVFYNIPLSSTLNDGQRRLENPVALAMLAKNTLKTFQIRPYFKIQYDLIDPAKQMLRLSSSVSFNVNNSKTTSFLPQEATNSVWYENNKSDYSDNESLSVYSDNNITWQPNFSSKDHSLLLYGAFQVSMGSSSSQVLQRYGVPSEHATDASTDTYLGNAGSWYGSWRGLAYMLRGHYAYKGRYILDGTLRIDGSTKFGESNKYGTFPGVSVKYIMSDETFMRDNVPWISMLAYRYAWGLSGNQPSADYLFYSRYANYGSYMDISAIRPQNLRLDLLRWESTSSNNFGIDLGFLDDKFVFDINFYTKDSRDILFSNFPTSSTSGFGSLSYKNAGAMYTTGWEVNLYSSRILQLDKFSVDFTFNLSNFKNVLTDLDPKLLENYNADFNYRNGSYLTRIQTGNPYGSIYGFRYKGVYAYDKYIPGEQEDAPVARDADGNAILDQRGNPKNMYFAYGTPSEYRFRGGDARYEDINHDGSIDELDIVYLGNANPKLNGGFGPTFRYGSLTVRTLFNFRYGNKIINNARMNAENMYGDNNQSIAVNWRWREEGDGADKSMPSPLPRALYNTGFNWLGSDRFVEDGSFLRFKYLSFNYNVPSGIVKKININKINVYLTFNNLFVLTKYTGVDPEVGYGALQSDGGLSIDRASTPRTKDFTLGLTIGL